MLDQGLLDRALVRLLAHLQKIEKVGVFQCVARQVGLRGRQNGSEIGDGLAFASQRIAVDLHRQDVARPSLLDGTLRVSQAGRLVLQFAQQHEVVTPGQLSNKLLDNLAVTPSVGERSHVHQVGT